jgi:hypothetical protein
VGASGIADYSPHAGAADAAEREELDWLLTSGVLGRSGNLTRVLTYICEEHFQGRADQIKEYTIATEGLGRRSDFDPQTDTIVRVIIHSLRKRLREVYESKGAHRPLRLIISSGSYAPSFVHPRQWDQFRDAHGDAPDHSPPYPDSHSSVPSNREFLATHSPGNEISALHSRPGFLSPSDTSATDTLVRPYRQSLTTSAPFVSASKEDSRTSIVVIALLLVAGLTAWWGRQEWKKAHLTDAASLAAPAPAARDTIHALMDAHHSPYVDHSGITWTASNYCQGGTSVSLPDQKIEGTEDAPLYLGGVRGITHCIFPVPPGLYELHFYFAETSDLPAATRIANLSINAGAPIGVDVVDDAGGHSIATSTVAAGVAPENDGAIHLDFVSEVSLLNAVEILPAPSPKLLPVRIVADSRSVTGPANQFWASDRYFNGGRHGQTPDSAKRDNLGIYESERIGRFRYSIPAVPLAHYRVKLYFRDLWFGRKDGGNGGPGSRIFDVACNGSVLLKNFDILAEGGSEPVVKTFDHVQASATGKIDLYFMPVVNYPLINAIEILPED